MKNIRVFIADDHTIFRQGLRALLEKEKDIEVVGEADNGEETIQKVIQLKPSILLMDIIMPVLDGLQVTYRIQNRIPDLKVIILSMSADEEYVRRALKSGVRGYLIKSTAARELLTAIREVEKGNAFFSPLISKVIIQLSNDPGNQPELSLRETDVLQLICDGKSSKEIASILQISYKTVQNHRQQLMFKLQVHDVVNLVNIARSKKYVRTTTP